MTPTRKSTRPEPSPRLLTSTELEGLHLALKRETERLGGETWTSPGYAHFSIGGVFRLDLARGLLGTDEALLRDLDKLDRVVRAALAAAPGGRR